MSAVFQRRLRHHPNCAAIHLYAEKATSASNHGIQLSFCTFRHSTYIYLPNVSGSVADLAALIGEEASKEAVQDTSNLAHREAASAPEKTTSKHVRHLL